MLLQLFPLPPGLEVLPGNPEPRVSIADGDTASLASDATCIPGYYTATISTNSRITAPDWYQDVRHFELTFDEDIECVGSHLTLGIAQTNVTTVIPPGTLQSYIP